MGVKEDVLKVKYREGDRAKFARICLTYDRLNKYIKEVDKEELLRFLRYLVETRPYSKTYITRVCARFNAMNRITWEDFAP